MQLSDSKFAKTFKDKYPVVTAQVNDCEKLNIPLAQTIKNVGDVQNHNTNVKADMTYHQMWHEKYPGHENFRTVCSLAIQLAMEHCPEKMRPIFKPVVTECWGAIYRQNEFTRPHDHWPAIWSFCYYVQASKNCSPIVFPGAKLSIKPKNGMMILFPGWVEHYVPKQKTSSERIMIAGNMGQKLNLSDNLD